MPQIREKNHDLFNLTITGRKSFMLLVPGNFHFLSIEPTLPTIRSFRARPSGTRTRCCRLRPIPGSVAAGSGCQGDVGGTLKQVFYLFSSMLKNHLTIGYYVASEGSGKVECKKVSLNLATTKRKDKNKGKRDTQICPNFISVQLYVKLVSSCSSL